MPVVVSPGDPPPTQTLSGDYALVFGNASTGIEWRRNGWELRDTVLITLVGGRHVPALLFQRPTPTSVMDSVLSHGTGALNIDACRVTVGRSTLLSDEDSPSDGRWPCNVLIVHTKSCHPLETVKRSRGNDYVTRSWYCHESCTAFSMDQNEDERPMAHLFPQCQSFKLTLDWFDRLLGRRR